MWHLIHEWAAERYFKIGPPNTNNVLISTIFYCLYEWYFSIINVLLGISLICMGNAHMHLHIYTHMCVYTITGHLNFLNHLAVLIIKIFYTLKYCI